MADAQPTPASLAQTTSALDRIIADVKARVGSFLGNEKILFDAKTRIDALASSKAAPVQANARALQAKGTALLAIQTDAENAAQALIGRAGDLRTQMETNPIYSFLKDQTPKYWGIRQYQLIGNLIASTAAMVPAGAALSARIYKQNADVKTFADEVASTENAAAGQGVLPAIRGVISSTVGATAAGLSSLVWPIAIVAAVAGGAYLLVPGLLSGRRR